MPSSTSDHPSFVNLRIYPVYDGNVDYFASIHWHQDSKGYQVRVGQISRSWSYGTPISEVERVGVNAEFDTLMKFQVRRIPPADMSPQERFQKVYEGNEFPVIHAELLLEHKALRAVAAEVTRIIVADSFFRLR